MLKIQGYFLQFMLKIQGYFLQLRINTLLYLHHQWKYFIAKMFIFILLRVPSSTTSTKWNDKRCFPITPFALFNQGLQAIDRYYWFFLTFHAFVIEVKIIMFILFQKDYYTNYHGYRKRVKNWTDHSVEWKGYIMVLNSSIPITRIFLSSKYPFLPGYITYR